MHKDDVAALVGANLVLIHQCKDHREQITKLWSALQKTSDVLGDLIGVNQNLKDKL